MRFSVVVAAIVSLVGCAGPMVQHQKIGAAKTAAIVGFAGSVDLRDPDQASGGITGTIGAFQSFKEVKDPAVEARRRAQAEQTYDLLAEKLSKQFGWTVARRDLVVSNPAMRAIFVERMGERQPNGGNRYGVPGIPWPELARYTPADQQKLKAALGVDVLVIASMSFNPGDMRGVTVGGMGKTDVFPSAAVSFTVVDGTDQGPLWDTRVVGAPAKRGVTSTMGVVQAAGESEAVVEAAGLGVDALLKRYEQVKAEAVASGR